MTGRGRKWSVPSAVGSLGPYDVHLWYADLNDFLPLDNPATDSLSTDEKVRAARYLSDRDRQRFLLTRVLLRTLLAAYLGMDSALLQFRYGAWGKPFLVQDDSLQFSLTHSEDHVLVGTTRQRLIGVDCERILSDTALHRLAERYFAPTELAELYSLVAQEVPSAFYRYWTIKEAYLKAVGVGLTDRLSKIEVSPMDKTSARLLGIGGSHRVATRWSVSTESPCPDIAVATMVEVRCEPLAFYYKRWQG